MADDEQLQRLLNDVRGWNAWRAEAGAESPDLRGADLVGAKLQGARLDHADFSGANLSRADLSQADCHRALFRGVTMASAKLVGTSLKKAELVNADLSASDLSGADLSRASLRSATLSWVRLVDSNLLHVEMRNASLQGADLTRANLRNTQMQNASLVQASLAGARFNKATLTGCDLTGAELRQTEFTNTSLRAVEGLGECSHRAPSSIDLRTLDRSGALPRPFLIACGLPRSLVTQLTAAYKAGDHSCFISYASVDEALARRLRDDLEYRHISCFLAADDMRAGDCIVERLEREIGSLKHVLLLLSRASLRSAWVRHEVTAALREESLRQRTVLIPVRLDDAVLTTEAPWARRLRDSRQIDDLSAWQNPVSYRASFDRLLGALTHSGDG